MFCVISVEPTAASVTLSDISFVVALCSPTAVAVGLENFVDLVNDGTNGSAGGDRTQGVVLYRVIFWMMSSAAFGSAWPVP